MCNLLGIVALTGALSKTSLWTGNLSPNATMGRATARIIKGNSITGLRGNDRGGTRRSAVVFGHVEGGLNHARDQRDDARPRVLIDHGLKLVEV